MQKSPGAEAIRKEFYAGNAKTRENLNYDTPAAYRDTLLTNPANWKSTAMQVGGFAGASATNNGDGTVTFRITNVAGANSFFLHAIPNRKSATGLMSNVVQIFEWTESIDQNRLPKTN
jgi:hypothetical protein